MSGRRKEEKYLPILEDIFSAGYKEGAKEINFKRTDIETVANKLNIDLPKNLGI